MGLFYTGKGDKGRSYIGKKSVDKTCVEIEALGNLDELNSLLGLIKSEKVSKEVKKHLHNIQEKLFIIQAQLATLLMKMKYKAPVLKKEAIKNIEKIIQKIEREVKPAKKFIIPGGHSTSAWLDYARSVARKTERSVLQTLKKKKVPPETLAYLNRLSSLLFALARYEMKKRNKQEKHPQYK